MQVKEIMTKNPVHGTPETSLAQIAQMMVENDCGCIPIVESGGSHKPVGAITDRDIVVRIIAENRNPLEATAADAMTEDIVTVTPETSVEDCCQKMEDGQIRRVIVVDNEGKLCGIIAQADIANNATNEKTAEVVQEVSKTTAS